MPVANLYREAMDQFAKGINVMVPHAVWYRPDTIIFPPELSLSHTALRPASCPPTTATWAGCSASCSRDGLWRTSRVLYPIAGLQAGYRFGVGKPYEGGVIPPEADYMELGERLALGLRHDFTFLHPEVLDDKCQVEGAVLRLKHPQWSQAYRVFIVPGGTAIAASNLRKLKTFYDQGGRVVFTTCRPEHSAEFGQDDAVRSICQELLGPTRDLAAPEPFTTQTNRQGGKAYFIAKPDTQTLGAVMADALAVPDVAWDSATAVKGGHVSYLHKTIEGRHYYFFANSSDDPVETTVSLRGLLSPELWDPHTGRMTQADATEATVHSQAVCRVRLSLAPVRSVFVVGETAKNNQP